MNSSTVKMMSRSHTLCIIFMYDSNLAWFASRTPIKRGVELRLKLKDPELTGDEGRNESTL